MGGIVFWFGSWFGMCSVYAPGELIVWFRRRGSFHQLSHLPFNSIHFHWLFSLCSSNMYIYTAAQLLHTAAAVLGAQPRPPSSGYSTSKAPTAQPVVSLQGQ
ncbi:hypothetical protein CI102_8790 [Trichoderma harzianum]|nr:hypothetical protein CI102_8790 [Trichoderma harzianum]